jgi:hypothetical protein
MARARREGVRALFHERRALTEVPAGSRRASYREAARRWVAAHRWWDAADLRAERDDAFVRAVRAARAARSSATAADRPTGIPLFVAERPLDPVLFTDLPGHPHC